MIHISLHKSGVSIFAFCFLTPLLLTIHFSLKKSGHLQYFITRYVSGRLFSVTLRYSMLIYFASVEVSGKVFDFNLCINHLTLVYTHTRKIWSPSPIK